MIQFQRYSCLSSFLGQLNRYYHVSKQTNVIFCPVKHTIEKSLAANQDNNWISHFIICAELSPYCYKKC